MSISKEAISVIESLAYKIHEVENHFHEIDLSEIEKNELNAVFDGLKTQIGHFFIKHLERRKNLRPNSSLEESYKGYWALSDKKHQDMIGEEFPISICKFCGSSDIKQRRNNTTGTIYWYCVTCRQENRALDNKAK